MFDVCVVGPLTRDVIRIPGVRSAERPGGVVYYAGITLGRLGLRTAVLTRAAPNDLEVLTEALRQAGVVIYGLESAHTTVFENIYAGKDLEHREQRVRSVATPFRRADLHGIQTRRFYLGPLTAQDMDASFLEAVSDRGALVCLDIQGMIRSRITAKGKVQLETCTDTLNALRFTDVVKANLQEARLLVGKQGIEHAARAIAELGPREVVVTLGDGGSLILADGKVHRIPSFAPRRVVDPTGCGDTYFAAYIFHRLQSDNIDIAGRFAAALATLKLERAGPFSGTERVARDLLARTKAHSP